jgi:hypothetical protein
VCVSPLQATSFACLKACRDKCDMLIRVSMCLVKGAARQARKVGSMSLLLYRPNKLPCCAVLCHAGDALHGCCLKLL